MARRPAPGRRPAPAAGARRALGPAPRGARRTRSTGHWPRGDGLPAPSPGLPAVRLLVVDQFEETFTRCTDPEERARFVQLLCAGDGGPRVVLGLRADHYGSCLAHPELVQALEHRQFTVPPMDAKALRDAVEEPAREAGLVLEAGLTDRLLADLEEDADLGEDADASDDVTALPFLAHALRETWLRRSGAALTLAGYQATGGIRKSVAMATEALYQELDGPGRSALRELLLRMVHLTARAEAVRRRLDLPALLADRPEEDRRRIGAVWERLAAARLVTVDQGGAQISHEALLRAWLRLRSWIREARAELLAHQQLSEAAAAWEEHGRDPGYLYTGSRLAAVRPLLTAPGMTLTTGERAFAEAGLRSARRARLRRTVVASVSGCLALLLTAVGTFALSERSRSQERAAELASKRIAAQAEALRSRDPAAALDLSLAAYRAAATAEARTSLLRSAMTPVSLTLTGHKDRVLNLALHKSGRVMASSSKDGTVRLWDIGDPYRPAPGAVLRTGKGVALAWRPDGRYLVATSADTFFVWDTSDPFRPREVARAAGGGQGIHGVAFSPDGRTVAVASARGRVRLWNMGDPARPVSTMFRVQSDQDVRAVAYRPDGKVLATGLDDGTVQLWEPGRTGEFEQLATTKGEPVGSLAFRPDGRRLAAGALRFVRFWDTEDPRHPRGLPNGLGSLQPQYVAVAFSADGQHIAAASTAEREVQTFDLDDKHGRADQGSRLPIGEPAWSVTYLPGGRGLAVGDETGRILLNLPPPRSLPGSVTDRTMGETGSATDESGRHLITDGYRENSPPVRVWDIGAPGRVPRRIAELSREWEQARFFPGGLVVSWNTGRTRLKLWRLDGDRLRPAHEFPRPEEVKKDTNWTEFSVNRDATLLALRAPGDDAMRLWDIRDRDHPRQLGRMPWPQGDGRVVAGFSGSKGLVAMMSNSSTQVWDVRDARHPRPAGKAKGRPFSTLGHDGRVALLTQETKQPTRTSELRLWTVDDDGTPHRSRSIGEDVDSIAALSGRALLTLSKDGRPAVWDLRKPQRGVPLPGPAPRMRYVMVSEERRLAVARNYEGALGIWRVSEPDGARPGGDDELLALFTDGDIGKVHELDDATGDLFVETGFAGPVAALGARTIVVSTDTDRLRAGLCAVRSTRVPEERWRELLPGVGRRDGCG
ncbi:WD40 repeat domain-containing protein [Streptomyces thioluteus]|uniref:WD40 repeat domain-containing protein n=1 Tax=Streptomyces thioluteus TaxID=66431 RepID=UPI0031EBE0D4